MEENVLHTNVLFSGSQKVQFFTMEIRDYRWTQGTKHLQVIGSFQEDKPWNIFSYVFQKILKYEINYDLNKFEI